MTPRDVDQLTDVELRAFWELLEEDLRDRDRQARAARRQARRR